MFADRLKKSLLQAAIQGQLTEQLPSDGDARDLLRKIRTEKAKLIAAKKIKAEKPLPPVTDDEIPFDIPDSWCWVRLGDVCQINPRNKLEDENIDATFLPMTSINDGYSNGYNPLIKSWNEIRNGFTHFADGDVIFAKITPCFQNRKSAVVDNLTNGIGAGTTELYVLRSYGKYINEKYLLYFVKNHQFILDGVATMKGTAGQQRISRNFVVNYLLPLPPFAEQKRIVLSEVDELVKDERELVELEGAFPRRMRNSLLQAAIQGKLTEQLPSDGDARDLLRKIHTKKAKLVAEKKIKAEKPLPPIKDDEIPFDLPDNWCWCRLGDIGIFISGYTPQDNELTSTGKIPYFKVADMNTLGNELWLKKTKLYLRDEVTRIYERNTIVYPKNGGAIFTNKKRILQQDSVVDLNTGGYRVIEPLNLMYVFNYFLTIDFKFFYKGTAVPTIDNKRLRENLFPLPPLAEQKRIVKRLEELLPLCETEI